MKLLFILIFAAQLAAQQIISLQAPPPPPVATVSVTVAGPSGNGSYCYWIVANYARGQALPIAPACIDRAPDALSFIRYIAVTWAPQPGVTSYDVLRTADTAFATSGVCVCAVAIGLGGNAFNDTGTAATAYQLAPAHSATATITLNNRDQAMPAIVFDPPVTGGIVGPATPTVLGGVKPVALDFVVLGDGTLSIANKLTVPADVGLLAINTANGALLHPTVGVLTTALCAIPYFLTTTLCPQVTISVSPGSQTEIQTAATAAYTLTLTGLNAGANIVPSVSGLPANTSVSFSPTFVGPAGGSVTATITTANAPIGTSTLSFVGTSGSSISPPATATFIVIATPPGNISVSGSGTWTSPQNLTGSLDWATFRDNSSGAWNDHKSGGLVIASTFTLAGSTGGFGGASVNWTDGAITPTGSNIGTEVFPSSSVTFNIIPATATKTITFLTSQGDSGSGVFTITLHSTNTGIADATTTVATNALRTTAFTFRDASGSPIVVTIAVTSGYPVYYAAMVN